jgi:predicted O-methyltransferase YrrM
MLAGMDVARQELAARVLERSREHDAGEPDRLRRYRNLEPDSARLLALLVLATAPRRVLELGTSNGYSTLWLGDACEQVGTQLVSVDVDGARQAEAAEHLREAGLEVTLREQDGGALLRESPDAAWDLVFLDAERDAYAGWWPDLRRTLAPGGLLAIDNVLSHAAEVAHVTALIGADAGVESTVVPVGAGLRLVVRRR